MARRPKSLARRVFALQLVVLSVVIIAGGALAIVDARRDADTSAREQVLGIAESLALNNSTATALTSADPTSQLQPEAERIRTSTGVDFITIMAPDRTRFTHTNPQLIGQAFIGNIEPALRGETFTEI